MSAIETIVIVGAGLAGHSAAETLRKEGFEGRVFLFGEEASHPYDRPPLSKEFLKGDWQQDRLYYQERHLYSQRGIELHLNVPVDRIDTEAQLVFARGMASLRYDHLLLAMGGYPQRLSIPGSELQGIHYLRTIDDAANIGSALKSGARLVVVGAGFIGCEVAAAARSRGVEVTVLEALSLPMGNVLGPEVGEFYAAEHRAHGVDLRLSEGVAEFRGEGSVSGVLSSLGNFYPCDAVVAGIGLTPAVEVLKGTPVHIENGVVVDEYCRTNIPNVYAAGDVANWWHPRLRRRMRLEHWDNAAKQAETAARNMLGKHETYCPTPYFWSDQYDLKLQLFGSIQKDRQAEVVMRGQYTDRAFNLFYMLDGAVVAALGVNKPRESRAAVRLIESGIKVDPALLSDPTVDVRKIGL